jgi:hypothetical protein
MIDSVIANQALSGVEVPREVVEAKMDEVLGRPMYDSHGRLW